MAARERAGRPSRFGGFVGRPWGRAGGPELAAQQHHRAAACAASSAHKSRHEGGQRPSGHRPRGATADVATKGARRDVCAALEPRRSARHALFAVSPTSPRGHKSIRLRPLEMNTKEGAEGELRTAPCYDRTGDGTILSAAGGPNAHFRWEVPVETISYSGSPGGRGKRIELHRLHERDA